MRTGYILRPPMTSSRPLLKVNSMKIKALKTNVQQVFTELPSLFLNRFGRQCFTSLNSKVSVVKSDEQKATRNRWRWIQTVSIRLNGLREGEKGRNERTEVEEEGRDGWSNHQAEQIG